LLKELHFIALGLEGQLVLLTNFKGTRLCLLFVYSQKFSQLL